MQVILDSKRQSTKINEEEVKADEAKDNEKTEA